MCYNWFVLLRCSAIVVKVTMWWSAGAAPPCVVAASHLEMGAACFKPAGNGSPEAINECSASISDSPFIKQSTENLWHKRSDSDVSSAAKDSAQTGGNSAASSAVASSSKQGSDATSGLPSTAQTSKNSSPDGNTGSQCLKSDKPKLEDSKACFHQYSLKLHAAKLSHN
jgi:hypothetical protein